MPTDYIATSDAEFLQQLSAFESAIPAYATALSLSPAQLESHSADTLYFRYLTASLEVMRNSAQQWTRWRDIIRGGGLAPLNGAATVPVLPATIGSVDPGIEARFRALAKIIKAHPNYNTAIGKALGIIRDASAGPNLATISPVLAVNAIGSGIFVDWKWGGYSAHLDQCEIQVDRADGKGFTLLTYDTTPGYLDTYPKPATFVRWIYRAIYRVGDRQIGVWSSSTSILVGEG